MFSLEWFLARLILAVRSKKPAFRSKRKNPFRRVPPSGF